MLVLRTEDLFKRTVDILKLVLNFLGLPDWEPGPSEIHKNRDKDEYEQKMDPATTTVGIITVDLQRLAVKLVHNLAGA